MFYRLQWSYALALVKAGKWQPQIPTEILLGQTWSNGIVHPFKVVHYCPVMQCPSRATSAFPIKYVSQC